MCTVIRLNSLLFCYLDGESAKSDTAEKTDVQPPLMSAESDSGKTLKMLVFGHQVLTKLSSLIRKEGSLSWGRHSS